MKNRYKGSKVVIIGLGITGLSCINFFLSRGIIPKVIDTRQYPTQFNKLPNFIRYCFGMFNDVWILDADLIVISPGVRLDHPVLQEAMKLGIEIVGDIELFIREITAPVIAITGSNGKSTVTQLVAKMASCAGWNVGVAGNIGVPALTLLNRGYQLYVLEMSSFQLDTTYSLQAAAATILNVSEDHMDRYSKGLSQYHFSKQKIYYNAVTCVINDSDPLTKPISMNYNYLVSFSANSDSAHYRLEYYKKNLWIVVYDKILLNCSSLSINNHINYNNILSALALSDSVKIPRIASIKVLQYFYTLPHRFQLIYKNHNIRWINDSKATNVGATRSAIINTMDSLSGRLHLLLGGDGKLSDFSIIKNLIKKYEIHLYCFGKDGLFLSKLGFNHVFLTKNMMDALYIIRRRVLKKDVVLLSPACSSLDQFISFKKRGDMFVYFARKFG